VAGGVAGLLLSVLLFAPASWLASRVARATEGHVLLQDARGTVWNGSAVLVLTGGTGSSDAAALPTRLAWQLRPAWGGARLALRTECCTPAPLQVRVRAGWRRTTVAFVDGASSWPAALLAGLGTPWNTLQPDGELAFSTQGLSLEWAEGRLAMAGRAELLAQRMSSRLSTLRPMGSYRLVLAGGAVPALQLSTVEGDLRLTGSGQWVGSRLRFTGEASASPEREAALTNLLNIIGRRNGARSIITIG
jgi:general secretion pathway protein N